MSISAEEIKPTETKPTISIPAEETKPTETKPTSSILAEETAESTIIKFAESLETKPTETIEFADPTETKPTISISAEETAEDTRIEVAKPLETEPTVTIEFAEPTVTQPPETKPTISISAKETAKETRNEVAEPPETEPTVTIEFAEPTITQPTKTKPTISVSAEETRIEFAETTDSINKEAAETTEPDWLNSMTADSLFHSDAEIDSMDLHVSDDSEDSAISVEREFITTQGKPVTLVYPFVAGFDIENASKGLHLGEENNKYTLSHLLMLQQEKVAPRSYFITMHQSNFARLNPNQYLNDVVVDFWLQWITRKEANEELYIMFFNTQFYSAILLTGVSCVIKWNEKRGVDIFAKKILVIPVNRDNHWSLCAVCNTGQIAKVDKKDRGSGDIPFIMFLDPLDFHS
jgi:hypothetical protein